MSSNFSVPAQKFKMVLSLRRTAPQRTARSANDKICGTPGGRLHLLHTFDLPRCAWYDIYRLNGTEGRLGKTLIVSQNTNSQSHSSSSIRRLWSASLHVLSSVYPRFIAYSVQTYTRRVHDSANIDPCCPTPLPARFQRSNICPVKRPPAPAPLFPLPLWRIFQRRLPAQIRTPFLIKVHGLVL